MAIRMPKKVASPEEFIAGATTARAPASPALEVPWLNPRVRDDLRIQVNTKLPEKLVVQWDWLAVRLGRKKQDILEVALRSWIETELRKLGIGS